MPTPRKPWGWFTENKLLDDVAILVAMHGLHEVEAGEAMREAGWDIV